MAAINPFYIPTPGQQGVAERAAALGVVVASDEVPPVYAAAVEAAGGTPCVCAEFAAQAIALFDNGSIQPSDVTNLIAPLVAAYDTAQTDAANLATIEANALGALAANATFLALASPTLAQYEAQIEALTHQVDGVIRYLFQQLSTTT